VIDRDSAAVFPLIERLVSAGADLAEFMGGAGEALRALLMIQLGAEPAGLTEALRAALHRVREQPASGDILRMLRLLTESEQSIRRSANPRLVVETLLLRWTMLDRMVDLEQVLAGPSAAQSGATTGAVATGVPPAPPPALASSRFESRARPDMPSAVPVRPALTLPAEFETLQSGWNDVVGEVRARSRFLGEALAATQPQAVDASSLTVSVAGSNQIFAESLRAQAGVIEEVIERLTGRRLRFVLAEATPEGDSTARPARTTDGALQADRLKVFRAKDPALDTVADALDLEILE
jgi:DNA polymerase-3 subunit gamma/tau